MASTGQNPADENPVTSRPSMLAKLTKLLSSRYALSLAAQAMVSGFHFALNLYLVRTISLYEYGVFAYAFVLALFAAAVNNALISTPLTVYTPVLKDKTERTQQEAMFSTLNLLLFCLLVVAGIAYTWWSEIPSDISVAVTLFVAVYSARQFSRSFGYSRLRPLVTASGDITYVLASFAIIVVLHLTQDQLPVSYILLALAAGNLIAMLIERFRLHGSGKKWISFADLRSYVSVWEQSRWALIGALTTLFLAQAHSLIITWHTGPEAYAPLAAGFVLFGPVRVALLTWQNMVKPELAMALSNNQQDAVSQQIKRTVLLMAAAVLVLGICLMIAWPWIHGLLYEKKYADQPMAIIVALWSLTTLFAAIYNAPAAALQAMKEFRVLAMASIFGAIISGVLVTILLFNSGPVSTLYGILLAECFMAIYLTRVMLTRLKGAT